LNLQPLHDAAQLLARLDDLDLSDLGSFLTTHTSGLQVLLLPGAGTGGGGQVGLRRVVIALRKIRPFVIVDAPARALDTVPPLLELADLVLVVLTPEITALRGARLLLEQAAAAGLPPGRIHLLLNRFPLRGGLDRGAIENVLGSKILGTIPDDARLVTYSANRGLPLVLSHGGSAIARHIGAVAGILARTGDQPVAPCRAQAPCPEKV
ncbi:MAG: hypothetical protein QME94_00570, partial [Anaerolineae bacterium]|nr:hypothetical protein [Anaerolineae bacterium]